MPVQSSDQLADGVECQMTQIRDEVRESDTREAEPFIIRDGRPGDAYELSYHWGEARAPSQMHVLDRYFGEVERGIQACQVAVWQANGDLVGQLWTRFRNIDPAIANGRTECYMHTLFVMDKYRRHGIARALVESASSAAGRFGRPVLVIGVDRPNDYARRLYEKWGFKAFYETNHLRGDLIFLRRRLL